MATLILTIFFLPCHCTPAKSPYPLEEDKHDIAGQGGHIGCLLQSFSSSQLGDEGSHRTFSPWGHIPEKGTTIQLGTTEEKSGDIYFKTGPNLLSCSSQENIPVLRQRRQPRSPTAQIPPHLRLPNVATVKSDMLERGLPALFVPALPILIRSQHSPGWQQPQPCRQALMSQLYL